MAVQLDAIFEGKVAEKFLQDLEKKIKKTVNAEKEILGLITARVHRDVIQHFERQEGSDGGWTPWSDSYSEFMAKIGKSGNLILQNTGRLRNSFQPSSKQTKGQFAWVNPAKTSEGFAYAYAHDEGGSRLPKRDFMWLSDDAQEDVAKIMLDYVVGD